jgi:hypothetical protein
MNEISIIFIVILVLLMVKIECNDKHDIDKYHIGHMVGIKQIQADDMSKGTDLVT